MFLLLVLAVGAVLVVAVGAVLVVAGGDVNVKLDGEVKALGIGTQEVGEGRASCVHVCV